MTQVYKNSVSYHLNFFNVLYLLLKYTDHHTALIMCGDEYEWKQQKWCILPTLENLKTLQCNMANCWHKTKNTSCKNIYISKPYLLSHLGNVQLLTNIQYIHNCVPRQTPLVLQQFHSSLTITLYVWPVESSQLQSVFREPAPKHKRYKSKHITNDCSFYTL